MNETASSPSDIRFSDSVVDFLRVNGRACLFRLALDPQLRATVARRGHQVRDTAAFAGGSIKYQG